MKRFLTVIGLVITLFLVVFFIFDSLKISFLEDPESWLSKKSPLAATLGVLLLTADVIIPVPASLVMTANGIYFGVFIGSLLSLLGGIGSSLAAFAMGRYSTGAIRFLISEEEWKKGQVWLASWGLTVVIITRPIPILAETVAMLAGTSSISWYQMAISSILGLLPPVLLYSISGASAATALGFLSAFTLSLVLASGFWWLGRRLY